MIVVSILRRQDNGIEGFEVKGHANYAKAGQDIVCAGVSAVTVGTVNSIEALTGIVMDSEMKNGFLNASLPSTVQPQAKDQAQLLLASMVVMLKGIEGSYGKYIKIQDIIT
ncbi:MULTISPECIES: ribosomal-processing cysteine protease Prp [Paenibacillus]|uniref:Ribosomal processing cysteine protease Prp n=1 Tax=Paenibacillus anaericanus TaxID=170367 RepID=A0A3S1JZV9_9BACL|nr:ribosomal-processing cysteine protease Prp [Paenibacillus anaericanus]RUT40682.1 ribosomal-processing cysteine protease Prp [Paenibacillus anaericanus]